MTVAPVAVWRMLAADVPVVESPIPAAMIPVVDWPTPAAAAQMRLAVVLMRRVAVQQIVAEELVVVLRLRDVADYLHAFARLSTVAPPAPAAAADQLTGANGKTAHPRNANRATATETTRGATTPADLTVALTDVAPKWPDEISILKTSFSSAKKDRKRSTGEK